MDYRSEASRCKADNRAFLLAVALWAVALPSEADRFAHEYRVGRIRIFYDTVGTNAVDIADRNANGVPDQVEDIAKQTQAAYTLFVEALGFPGPFQTERYRGAAFLDIHLLNKSRLGSNGVTYDELQHFHRPSDPPNTRSLCFNVATSVKAPVNLTPAHEFFHVLQNSLTYFKNRWFTEGMARWSGRALGAGGLGKIAAGNPWPVPPEKQPALFQMTYDAAEQFWNPLAARDDPVGAIPEARVPPELKTLTYSNRKKVLEDFRLTGWELMREILSELEKADDIAFRQLGYDRWSEENQKSERNNPFILEAVSKVVARRQATKR
ncbi:MAG: hypothetical protein N3B01_02870 [Verrucomicrobiae bacterium]|nr:hypothetical protein [Verrucomicrobiae bacterium]